MDTTSNALSRTLSILAADHEVQDRLRQEILSALEKNNGQDLSYDELVSLPFLDAVCRETLRLWVRRLCSSLPSDHQYPTVTHLSRRYSERT
jgi:cytochrome P450